MKKIIYSVLLVFILCAGVVYYYVFVYAKTHHRNIQEESSIIINANELISAYETSDSIANTKFLNKALEVKGPIASLDTNAIGQITIIMGDTDPFKKRVAITLNTKTPLLQKTGDTIIVKGKCTGNLSDVVITEAAIKK